MGARRVLRDLRSDWDSNPRDPKALFILTGFRLCKLALGDGPKRRLVFYPLEMMYRFFTEFVLGVELRPKTKIGGGLHLYHGTGLVVNDGAVIGCDVTLRNGVTIGHQVPGQGCPVLEDGVQVGANAVIIGDIRIGRESIIGAGAVVTRTFPPRAVIAGNPARLLRLLDDPGQPKPQPSDNEPRNPHNA